MTKIYSSLGILLLLWKLLKIRRDQNFGEAQKLDRVSQFEECQVHLRKRKLFSNLLS